MKWMALVKAVHVQKSEHSSFGLLVRLMKLHSKVISDVKDFKGVDVEEDVSEAEALKAVLTL